MRAWIGLMLLVAFVVAPVPAGEANHPPQCEYQETVPEEEDLRLSAMGHYHRHYRQSCSWHDVASGKMYWQKIEVSYVAKGTGQNTDPILALVEYQSLKVRTLATGHELHDRFVTVHVPSAGAYYQADYQESRAGGACSAKAWAYRDQFRTNWVSAPLPACAPGSQLLP